MRDAASVTCPQPTPLEPFVAPSIFRAVTWQSRLMQLPKVQDSTLHGKHSRFLRRYEFFVGEEAPAYNRRLRWHKPFINIAGNCLVADEGMVFQFYGLNWAGMPHSVPFGQQTNRKRQSSGRVRFWRRAGFRRGKVGRRDGRALRAVGSASSASWRG
jgi:hypothetical protein